VPDLVRQLDRIESLLTYGVLAGDLPDLTGTAALAAQVCGTPSAAIGFLVDDRVEVVAAHAAPVGPIPRHMSLSVRAVEHGEPVVVPDARQVADPDHPFAGGGRVGAFAAVPLVGRDGLPLGVLAVHGPDPVDFTPAHIEGLRELAEHVMTRLELHRLDTWSGRSLAQAAITPPTRVRRALDDGELIPHLQPIVDLRTGRTTAVEALLRWDHPERGLVGPDEFLPVVEASGLVLPVGRQVRQRALDALGQIRSLGSTNADMALSVNISPIELARPQLAAEVLDDLADRNLPPSSLVVEVTETAAFVDPRAAIAQLTALHEAGLAIALDDYGAGHSSLQRVLSLPLSVLKLDRALTEHLTDDARLGTVVASTITMAADLGLTVLAEGVESALHAEALQAMGCEYAQGWHFGRPASVADTLTRLGSQRRARVRAVPRPRRAPDDTSHRAATPSRAARAPGAPAYVVDLDQRIRWWNGAAAELTGYAAADVIGTLCSDRKLGHVDADGRQLCGDGCPLLETMRDGEPRQADVWLHHRKGHLVPVTIVANPLRDADGQIIGAIETFRDIPPAALEA
jgi:PAS domain S-box-containing protein